MEEPFNVRQLDNSVQIHNTNDNHNENDAHKVKLILLDILDHLKSEAISNKLNYNKEMCGNDALKTIQYILPIITQVQMDVLKRHGYSATRESIINFTQMIHRYQQEDSAIRQLNTYIKSYFLPPFHLSEDTISLV